MLVLSGCEFEEVNLPPTNRNCKQAYKDGYYGNISECSFDNNVVCYIQPGHAISCVQLKKE